MNVQEDEPMSVPPEGRDQDPLSRRHAGHGEPVGDPILIRRAETAEAAAHALEDRLAGIQTRLREAELESQSASQRLADRERELDRASRRLSEGEQQLRSVSERLSERERELHSVSERLSERERELGSVTDRLAERERQLDKAELEIRARIEALESRVEEVQRDLLHERDARQSAERELQTLREAQSALSPLIGDLKQIAKRLRLAAEEAPAAQTPAPVAPAAQTPVVPGPAALASPQRPESGGPQMAEALAAAVQRLRARVAAVGEVQEQPAETEPTAEEPPAVRGVAYTPALADGAPSPRPWLAPAIKRVAQRRDARLAAELVLELLPAQALSLEGALRYTAKIAELGSYEVTLADGRGAVRNLDGAAPGDPSDFTLEGPAAAFAELAAGGCKLSSWRPPAGLRIHGRRRAKRLLASRRVPLSLIDLQHAGVTVWPGLLLLALAEAIDPASTVGQAFTIAFEIDGEQSAVLQVRALGGRPLVVTRVGEQSSQRDGEHAWQQTPQTTVRLTEKGFACMVSGADLAGESILLEGDPAPLHTLLGWTDRVQGIRRHGA